jgi:hypothetical protein
MEGRLTDDSEKVAAIIAAGSEALILVEVPNGITITEDELQTITEIAGRSTEAEERLWVCCNRNRVVFANTWTYRPVK